jgi:hypothetical protein
MIRRTRKLFKANLSSKPYHIAFKWAPILYQHINPTYLRRDLICAINYDDDWNTSNNKDNIDTYSLVPVVYYKITETTTHYYLLYCFYHADDATHENDLEGCLVVVSKRNESILGIITLAHFSFFSYLVQDRIDEVKQEVNGILHLEQLNDTTHPMVRTEANKHGCCAWGGAPWWMPPNDTLNSVGIRYIPTHIAEAPDEGKIGTFRETTLGYILIDILGKEGFWKRRKNRETFSNWGTFNSSTFLSANAPWVWDDFGGDTVGGMIYYDPAGFAQHYFKGLERFSRRYKKFQLRLI